MFMDEQDRVVAARLITVFAGCVGIVVILVAMSSLPEHENIPPAILLLFGNLVVSLAILAVGALRR